MTDVGRPSVTPDRLRQAFRTHAEGVTIVTTTDESGVHEGITATSVTSVSLDPPLLLVCIHRQCRISNPLAAGASFVVHFLAGGQEELALQFARPVADRFGDADYSFTGTGTPRLAGALAAVECLGQEVFEGGDHLIVVGRVVDILLGEATTGLAFFDGRFATLPVGGDASRGNGTTSS